MNGDPDICIYHAPCQDGFTAAWAVWHRYGGSIRYHPAAYGFTPPDVAGLDVLMVDFSYKRPVLEAMLRSARSVTILDHHTSAERELDGLGALPNADITFDMSHSGAVLAWEYLYDTPAPRLCEYVEDRDLWRFALPGSREVSACLFSHFYNFETWSELAKSIESPNGLVEIVAEGRAILRKHDKDIAEFLQIMARPMVIGGHQVRVANLPYTMASDAAGLLAQDAPFGACYFDRADGKRVFSLRSRSGGIDVSKIAEAYGGGGHVAAAGFTATRGWEGE